MRKERVVLTDCVSQTLSALDTTTVGGVQLCELLLLFEYFSCTTVVLP